MRSGPPAGFLPNTRTDTVMKCRKAFSLVELLVVVVILMVLAVIVLPKFSNASASTRAVMLMDDLRVMRSQMVIFKAQHRGVSPGVPGEDLEHGIRDFATATTSQRKDRMTVTQHNGRAHVVQWALTRPRGVGVVWPWIKPRHAVAENQPQTANLLREAPLVVAQLVGFAKHIPQYGILGDYVLWVSQLIQLDSGRSPYFHEKPSGLVANCFLFIR